MIFNHCEHLWLAEILFIYSFVLWVTRNALRFQKQRCWRRPAAQESSLLLLMRIFFFSPPCCWKKVTKNRSLGPATAAATHSKGRQWLGQHWNPAETTAGAARKVTPWTNTRHNFKVGKNQVSLLKWLLNWNSINSPKSILVKGYKKCNLYCYEFFIFTKIMKEFSAV